jgi:hypothetical protein
VANLGFTYAEKSDLTTSAFTAAAQNPARKYIYLINTHATNIMYAKFGAAAEASKGFKIAAGGVLEFGKDGGPCPIDYLSVIGSAASTSYQLVEGS